MAAMKWWGWGLDGVEFTHEDKPELAPFIKDQLGLDVTQVRTKPPRFEEHDVPVPNQPDAL
jgi:alkyldihydroxyacetonephosphate synthase